MRSILRLAALLSFMCNFSAAQRLPEITAPDHYKLSFSPDFTNNDFVGDETIEVRVMKPASQIVLNAAEIDFQEVTIASGQSTQKATVALDPARQTATLTVDRPDHPAPRPSASVFAGFLTINFVVFISAKTPTVKSMPLLSCGRPTPAARSRRSMSPRTKRPSKSPS